ncbi:MAG: ABC transporter ATP-binding protein/permease [Clostridiales bacterium]|jgi:ATP-binding cassette subfamily B protein|nr:ABC transporter ATP-binding protein/permease [Clostridiales bacterium]
MDENLQGKYRSATLQSASPKSPAIAKGAGGMQTRFSGAKPRSVRQIAKRLSAFLKGERLFLAASMLLILVHVSSSLAASYMLRPIINIYIAPKEGRGSLAGLALSLAAMAALYLLSAGAYYFLSRIMLSISQRAQTNIRKELFSKMQKLPVQFYDQNSNGDLMSRFANDVDAVGEMLNSTTSSLFSGAATLAGTIFLMFSTNALLAALALLFIPLTAVVIKKVTDRGKVHYRRQQAALGSLNGYIEESIGGQKVIKVFCHEEATIGEFSRLNLDYRSKQIKSHSIGSLIMPLTQCINNLTYATVACAGVLLVAARGFDIGGITVIINYARQFGRPINELSGQMNTIYSALAGAERIFEVIDSEPEQADSPDALELESCEGLLSLENVTFGYRPGIPVLKNISLKVQRGEKAAFVGSTGAGKTTLANLIPRFYDIWEGRISVDGIDIRAIKRDSLRNLTAVILQDTHLFAGSIRENIRYGRLDATDQEVEEAAKIANAHSFILKMKDGYDAFLDQDGANLSQGQRQLLNIARAALSKAPILIMDEATSSVDARSEIFIEEGLRRLHRARTTLVIAHRLSTVRDADKIFVMERGEIIEQGDHDSLVKLGGRYFELLTGKAELV